MIRALLLAAATLAACAPAPPTAETLHRRRIVDVVSECVLKAREESRAPSTFRASIDATTITGGPGRMMMVVRVPIRAENAMGGVEEGDAICAQHVPGGPLMLAVVPR